MHIQAFKPHSGSRSCPHQKRTDSTAPWSVTSGVQTSEPFQGCNSSVRTTLGTNKRKNQHCGHTEWSCRTWSFCRCYQRTYTQDTRVRWSVVYLQSSTCHSDATERLTQVSVRCGTALLVSPQLSIPPASIPDSSNCRFQVHLTCFHRSSALMRPRRCDFDFGITPQSLRFLLRVVFVRLHGYPAMFMLCPFPAVVGDERFCLHSGSWCRCPLGLFSLST